MEAGRTTVVEIRADLLEALRELYPDTSDRDILEDLARDYLLRRNLRDAKARSGLSEEEAEGTAYEELAEMRRDAMPARHMPTL